jgi:hypothetical protein
MGVVSIKICIICSPLLMASFSLRPLLGWDEVDRLHEVGCQHRSVRTVEPKCCYQPIHASASVPSDPGVTIKLPNHLAKDGGPFCSPNGILKSLQVS